jgi:hypothetical protein
MLIDPFGPGWIYLPQLSMDGLAGDEWASPLGFHMPHDERRFRFDQIICILLTLLSVSPKRQRS